MNTPKYQTQKHKNTKSGTPKKRPKKKYIIELIEEFTSFLKDFDKAANGIFYIGGSWLVNELWKEFQKIRENSRINSELDKLINNFTLNENNLSYEDKKLRLEQMNKYNKQYFIINNEDNGKYTEFIKKHKNKKYKDGGNPFDNPFIFLFGKTRHKRRKSRKSYKSRKITKNRSKRRSRKRSRS